MRRLKSFAALAEEKGEKAHKEAIAMGLKYGGFGYWKDPQTNETKFKTVNDQLVPVEGEDSSELADKRDEGGGGEFGPGGEKAGGDKRTAGRGATQQPVGPGAEPGRDIGSAEPGMEQAPKRMRWDPGPDGDHCVDSGQPPGDIPDDAFVGKTNYYQWTAGPDGTNYMNVSYDNIMKAAKEQGDQTAQAPPGGMQEETDQSRPRPGAGTMMNQMMGAKKLKTGDKFNDTIGQARDAVKAMKNDSDKGPQVALGNQIMSMQRIAQRGKMKGQETWDAEMGKQNDMWQKALEMPVVKDRAAAVKRMNRESKDMLSNPDFDMEMGEELGEGAFGTVGISAKDPNVVIKEGQIGPDELKALHAMRDNPGFPSLINAEFLSPFADSGQFDDIGNAESQLGQISQWWDPEDESGKPRFPAALGRFAMTKLQGNELSELITDPEDYEMDENGDSPMGDIARKIWQLRGQLHRKGFSHNDMHGGNIYIDDNKNVSMLDLGLAQDDPLSALTEATGGVGLKDFLEGDGQLADEGQWKNLPRGLSKKLMDNASGVREMIYDASTEHMEGLDDDGVVDFDDALETLMTGGIRQQKEVLDGLRERIPMLQDRGGVMKLIERLYDGVGGTDTENTMSNAFDKRLQDTRIIAMANKIRKKAGKKPIEVTNKNVVPPKNLDFDFDD